MKHFYKCDDSLWVKNAVAVAHSRQLFLAKVKGSDNIASM